MKTPFVAWAALWVAGSGCSTTAPSAPTPPRGIDEIERRAHVPVEDALAPPTGRTLLRGGALWTAAGAHWDRGWLLIVDGRIAALGEGEPPADAARGAVVVDVAGKTLTPGLIDPHSHLGVYPAPGVRATDNGNEATNPNTAGVWAEHSFWTEDPGIERAVRGGVTTIQVLPGSANLFGGRGVTLHLRPTRGARAMRFSGAPDSLKMACGENPKRVYGQRGGAPSTRMGNVRGQREAWIAAARWLKDNKDKPDGEVGRDLAMETLAGVLEGRILLQVHCYTAEDMLDFMQMSEELGFKVRAFHHALEAYKIRDLLAKRGIGVATWADWWGFKLEGWDGIPESAALITEGGARVSIHSDSPEGIQRLNQEAAKAMFAGRARGIVIDDDQALRWVTANPAWMLGIDGEVGTLEVGKRADVVAWSASPWSVYAKADKVWIDGALVVDGPAKERWSDFELGTEVTP